MELRRQWTAGVSIQALCWPGPWRLARCTCQCLGKCLASPRIPWPYTHLSVIRQRSSRPMAVCHTSCVAAVRLCAKPPLKASSISPGSLCLAFFFPLTSRTFSSSLPCPSINSCSHPTLNYNTPLPLPMPTFQGRGNRPNFLKKKKKDVLFIQ